MKIVSLRLRSKFYLSFGAVLLLGTVVAALMFMILQWSSASYKHVLETDRRVGELALTIRAAKLRISESLRGRLLHPYGDFGDEELKNLAAAYDELYASYAATRQLVDDPQLIRTLEGIERIDQYYLRPLEQKILEAIEQQESAEAERLYFDEYTSPRAEQQHQLDRLNDLAAERISASVEQTRARSSMVVAVAIGLAFMLIVAGCALSYYLTRSFERPINKLMQAARAIEAGDLEQQLSLDRKDEFGEMAVVLNHMVGNLRGLNEDLANQVRWLRETKDKLSRAQGQLVRQEKMAALGQLVAGVAHELNNPISFVYSNTILLKDSFNELNRILEFYNSNGDIPEGVAEEASRLKEEIDYDYLVGDISQALDDCYEGARRVRDIVMNLKTFSRVEQSELQVADLHEGIESTIKLLGQYFRPDRVVLHKDYADLPKINCYASQLSQVWMNLMVNAAQAMNSRGDLWITTSIEDDKVIVRFRDAGPGIPEEIATKIFDPFFTTKPVGEGTGLGLSIVHGIVERHGGEIKVESEPGVGTTFTVELPLTNDSSQPELSTELVNAIA